MSNELKARGHQDVIDCPHCGQRITAESNLSRWMREQSRFSNAIVSVVDADWIFHRFKLPAHGRDIQFVMQIEQKCHNPFLKPSQVDTLDIIDQISRTVRKGYPVTTDCLRPAVSLINNTMISVAHFGVHLLGFSGTYPGDSHHIHWDMKEINTEQLLDVLSFTIHPDTFEPIDFSKLHSVFASR